MPPPRFVVVIFALTFQAAMDGAQGQATAPARRDIHVSLQTGSDGNDGVAMPVKTIARGLKLAMAGDTVHLAPGRYKESAVFANKLGEPGQPITLDGHGAVLDGADPLNAADWQMTAPGLYRNDHLLRMDPAILMRWYFVFDGKMNHMGRTSKGPSAPLKKPEELAPGEWTYLPDAPVTRETKDGKPWDGAHVTGAFFIKIDPAKTLDDDRIEAPLRSAGVQFSGKCAHIVVRNVTATHVYNDGFNIHGDQRDLVFENITAIDCGDDGFSAHESAECRIDGFTSIGNSTGLCDTVASSTHYRNLYVRDCLGYDVFFTSHGTHSIENALIESSAAHAISVSRDSATEGVCQVRFKNVFARRVGGGPQEFRISRGAVLDAERCTFENLMVQATPGSAANFQRCVITGDPKPELFIWKEVAWRGAGNAYDVKSLRVDQTSFTPETFADFQKLTGSEQDSQWSAPEPRPVDLGADETALRKLLGNQIPK
ncbi:MAG: right-handed parallel beta-helix repeat-containing protein [Chthoniobacteraceae bacterium]